MITDIKVLENFYSNPEAVVNLLNGDYPIVGCGTGNRSIGLQEMSPPLYNDFCNAIYSIHGIDGSKVHMFTFFMEHSYNPIEIFNHGWMHIDGKNPDACRMTVEEYKLIVCGQIFLTKNPDPETGVTLGCLKPDVNWTRQEIIDKTINDYTIAREDYQAGKITLKQYEIIHKEYHDNFDVTCDVKNVYNRMVSWRAGTLHGAKMTNNMPKRLNQYFFVQLK
jgi:hypothetical protein